MNVTDWKKDFTQEINTINFDVCVDDDNLLIEDLSIMNGSIYSVEINDAHLTIEKGDYIAVNEKELNNLLKKVKDSSLLNDFKEKLNEYFEDTALICDMKEAYPSMILKEYLVNEIMEMYKELN